MMKQLYTFLLFLSVVAANAQISLDNSYFPAPGDILRTSTALEFPPNMFIPGNTGSQTWDFSALQAFEINEVFVKNAAEGEGAANFPNAEIVMVDGFSGAEEYVNVTGSEFEIIGYFGPDPTGLGVDVATNLEKPIVERIAPLTFGNFFSTESAFAVRFGWNDLPTALLDSFLNLPIQPDSLGIVFGSTRNDVVDAFGTLTIPGGTYEVLRQKRTEERSTKVEVKVPFLGWLDVTDLVPFGNIGDQTVVSYHFFSNEAKEAIARVYLNATEDTIQNIIYKYNPDVANNDRIIVKPQLKVTPNPIVTTADLSFKALPTGFYQVQLFDLLGSQQWSKFYDVNGQLQVVEDFADLNHGIYFMTLKDSKGKLLTTKKMMKVNP